MKSKNKKYLVYGAIVALMVFSGSSSQVFARAGGGGSSGGGGGGHSSGGFSSHSSSSRSGSGQGVPLNSTAGIIIMVIFLSLFLLPIIIGIAGKKKFAKMSGKFKNFVAGGIDEKDPFILRAKEIFLKFQEAWGKTDLAAMQELLTESYYKRMVLELSVMQNEKRANPMSDLEIYSIHANYQDTNTATCVIFAGATDELKDTGTGKTLFKDTSVFTEYWHFAKENGIWKLNLITQDTEDLSMVENEIAAFAQKNNFYFDPDFGWLMMPNKGAIFNKTSFGNSDINNHVVGYYRNKIVEFYTYIPYVRNSIGTNYLVAQTVLPKSYNDILVKKKGWFNLAPWGLKRMQSESVDFNNRFCIFATPDDQINSLELLTPNFMEKIYGLPFDLNIEIVGNFLYFYTKARGSATYENMLEIISWAFDEMKM